MTGVTREMLEQKNVQGMWERSHNEKICSKYAMMGLVHVSNLLYIGGFIFGVKGHRFEYDILALVDFFSKGLVEEVSLFESGFKARACG